VVVVAIHDAAAIATFTLSTAPTAAAQPLEKWHDANEGSLSFDCDGLPVTAAWSYDVNGVLRSQGPDGLAFAVETVHGSMAFTNAETGKAMTRVLNIVVKDQSVVDNGDGTLTITVMGAGSEKSYGPDGAYLFNNPGQIRWQVLIDNGGTPADPFDDEFVADLGIVKGSTGRNDTEGRDFCADMREFTA
jgi:hypothetical protein